MQPRTISNLCWIVSGLAIAGSLLWIGLADDKGLAILLGIAAVGLARILVGDVARWNEEKAAGRHGNEDGDAESRDREPDNR